MTAATTARATLADLFTDLHRDGEHVSICHNGTGQFRADVIPAGTTALLAVGERLTRGDVWHGVNPVRADVAGRGTAEDVTRLAALWCDLDVKAGGMPTGEAARAVIADLSTMLPSSPCYVVHTGHGLHPYWLLDDDERLLLDTDEKRTAARAILARWRRLVTRVAVAHGGGVDAVFDLPRVLRTPGTSNHKDTTLPPVLVTVEAAGGHPLDVAQVLEAFDGYGVYELDTDTQTLGPPTAPQGEWPVSPDTCGYVARMIRGWATDAPPNGRHHWAFGQHVRLACAARLGCVTSTDYGAALGALQARLDGLRAGDGHRPGEVAANDRDAVAVAERKTEGQARAELGTHAHHETPVDLHQLVTAPPPANTQTPVYVNGNNGAEPVTATLDEVHATFRRWLGHDYDTDALDVVIATAAMEQLDGDPLWLLLLSGSGNAKTETVQALAGCGATITSTVSSTGALLSATSSKERTKTATGGLLRKMGASGVLVIKDVTSILSMSRDMRGEVLAALREVYDGRWARNVGTDGGQTLEWVGRLAVVGAVTTAWDRAHDVIASMGDRFVIVRMDSTTGRQAAGRQAIGNTGHEVQMRAELRAVVGAVIAGMDREPVTLTDEETDVLLAAADVVTLARTGVEFDYRGDVIDSHAPEMPTRFAKQLAQVVRGAVSVGADRRRALALAIRCARDSMPPLRLAIIDDVAANPDSATRDVRKRLGKPRATVDRQLQALHILGVVDVDETGETWAGKQTTVWRYRIADGIDPAALDHVSLPDLALPPPTPPEKSVTEGDDGATPHSPSAKSGKGDAPDPGYCGPCGRTLRPDGTCPKCDR